MALLLPTREQLVAERDMLLDQLDTSSTVWKQLEQILRCDKLGMALDMLNNSADERIRGRAAYADMLLNFPQTQAARRKQPRQGE